MYACMHVFVWTTHVHTACFLPARCSCLRRDQPISTVFLLRFLILVLLPLEGV